MMRAALVLLGLSLSTACLPVAVRSRPSASTQAVADAELGSQVALALYDARVPGWSEIRVQSENGRVTLEGPTADAATAQRALDVARAVRGVTSVEPRLVIRR